MIFNVLIEIINVASMLHCCLFIEQACFFDADIHDYSILAKCGRQMCLKTLEEQLLRDIGWNIKQLVHEKKSFMQISSVLVLSFLVLNQAYDSILAIISLTQRKTAYDRIFSKVVNR